MWEVFGKRRRDDFGGETEGVEDFETTGRGRSKDNSEGTRGRKGYDQKGGRDEDVMLDEISREARRTVRERNVPLAVHLVEGG